MTRPKITSTLCALILAAAILLGTAFAAIWVEQSRIYQQSRLLASLMGREDVHMLSIITDSEKRDVTAKFIGALTSAYINFELIPYNEAQTFAAVFQSLSEGIHISNFAYRRHDLLIYGSADTIQDYENFTRRLAGTGHFASIVGHTRPARDGGITFEIWCLQGS